MKFKKFIITIISITSAYFLLCLGLYFFEPTEYNPPDLSDFNSYFESYKKYSYENDDKFYLKQISENDIKSADIDKRIRYIDNTLIAIAENDTDFEQITSLSEKYDLTVCGYIEDVNFYQLESSNELSFTELMTVCDDLVDSGLFYTAIPDYFEETEILNTDKESETESEPAIDYNSLLVNEVSYLFVKLSEAQAVFDDTVSVNAGIIDFSLNPDSKCINIANRDECIAHNLTDDDLPYSYDSVSHGMHVAGIIGAVNNSQTTGVVPNAPIYSYNGINVSTSYWIANICDMIINNNVKAINLSMGYNTYISVSAALGCENSIAFIDAEQLFFSRLVSNLVNNGNEFVVCVAAGNDGDASLYKIFGGYFGYGRKTLLSNLDFFDIFNSKPTYVDAKYCFMLSNCPDTEAQARVITVGGVNVFGEYAKFSNVGKVDIAAPSVNIRSTMYDDKFEWMTGTSMATPYVTGTAIMLFSLNPNLTGEDVKAMIISSATQMVSVGEFDYPVLNICEAVKLAKF